MSTAAPLATTTRGTRRRIWRRSRGSRRDLALFFLLFCCYCFFFLRESPVSLSGVAVCFDKKITNPLRPASEKSHLTGEGDADDPREEGREREEGAAHREKEGAGCKERERERAENKRRNNEAGAEL